MDNEATTDDGTSQLRGAFPQAISTRREAREMLMTLARPR
jgi:hypothetical protein